LHLNTTPQADQTSRLDGNKVIVTNIAVQVKLHVNELPPGDQAQTDTAAALYNTDAGC
jgi:hypothetical protein